jgi:predicted DNA-binding transcriptional regulator AlpA
MIHLQLADETRTLWSIQDIAAFLGVSVRTARDYHRQGRIPEPLRMSKRMIRWNSAAIINLKDKTHLKGHTP